VRERKSERERAGDGQQAVSEGQWGTAAGCPWEACVGHRLGTRNGTRDVGVRLSKREVKVKLVTEILGLGSGAIHRNVHILALLEFYSGSC